MILARVSKVATSNRLESLPKRQIRLAVVIHLNVGGDQPGAHENGCHNNAGDAEADEISEKKEDRSQPPTAISDGS